MDRVGNWKNAKKWHKRNSGTLCCINNKKEYYVNSLEEARAFYHNGDEAFNENNLLYNIIKLEKEIKGHREMIQRAENILLNKPALLHFCDQVNKTEKETIYTLKNVVLVSNMALEQCEEKIQNIIKKNPEVEPYYIMHRITK